jgi:hypothetical protein
MKRLGYTKFVAQGGDWGAIITETMAAQGHPELLGIHSNMPGVFSADIDAAARTGAPAPSGLSADEKLAYEQLALEYAKGIGYGYQMGLRPQAIYGIADSPVGIAGYFLDHDPQSLALISRVFDGQSEGLTRDDILDNVTLAWLTNTMISGGRLYWEAFQNNVSFFGVKGVSIPVAVSIFPEEIYQAPKSWAERAYPKLIHYNKVRQGRALCRLGAAETLLRRGSSRFQTAAEIDLKLPARVVRADELVKDAGRARLWHKCEVPECPLLGRSWGMSRHISNNVRRPPLTHFDRIDHRLLHRKLTTALRRAILPARG